MRRTYGLTRTFLTLEINSSPLKHYRCTTRSAQAAEAICSSSTMCCITVRGISLAPFRRDLTRDECNCVSISKLAASSSPTESSMTASWSKMEQRIKADRRHVTNCIFFEASVSVRLNMSEPDNAQPRDKRLVPQGDQRRYTGEILHRTRPKTYRTIA